MHQRSSVRFRVLGLGIIILSVAACTPEGPIGVPTPISFRVDNPDAITGAVLGRVYLPQPEAMTDAFASGSIDAIGHVVGVLRPISEIATSNDRPYDEAFFVPFECALDMVNEQNARLAKILGVEVWDGERRDGFGNPIVDAFVAMTKGLTFQDGTLTTYTHTTYSLVASRSAWSATSDVCAFSDIWTVTYDLDITVGWQVLRSVETNTFDSATLAESATMAVASMTLEELAAVASVGSVASVDSLAVESR